MKKYNHYQAVGRAAGYYRANPHRFAADFLHLKLKVFQKILICMMDANANFCFIAARGLGKTFLIAVYCCIRCVLYPGTKICLASGTRGQAAGVLEKIKTEILPKSPELAAELASDIKTDPNTASCYFLNGSYIKVVTASDSSRGNRANILIIDEFRMVDKTTIDTILTKFLNVRRQPGYLSKPEYAKTVRPERNKQVYLSSAFFRDHWSYAKMRTFVKNMMDDTKSWFVCGLPYQLSIMEGLVNVEDIQDQMLDEDFSEAKWSINISVLLKPIEPVACWVSC